MSLPMRSPVSSVASSVLADHLHALGLERPPSPVSRASYTTASSELEQDEDGRPASPAELPAVPPLHGNELELTTYPNSRAFLDAVRFTSRSWRLNCVLGPAANEVRHELAQLADRHHDHGPQDRSTRPEVRIWMAVWSGKGEARRLESVLSKIGQGPVVLASPLDLDQERQEKVLQGLRLLAAKLRDLLPDAIPTPGGTTSDDLSTPFTNAPAVLGPHLLSRPFAAIWLELSPPQTDAPPITAPLRAYGYILGHLPCRIAVASNSLPDLMTVRLATELDDLIHLASMYEEYASATSTPVDRSTSRRIVKAAVANGQMWIYYVESVTSPSINLVAGFLSTGSETATSIAITAVYTSEIYRGKGVAESLIRAACRANLEKPKPGKSSIVALIPDPGVVRRASSHSAAATKEGDQKPPAGVRLFARLGFRILDNEEYSLVGSLDGVEANEGEDSEACGPFAASATPPSSISPQLETGSESGSDDAPTTPICPPGQSLRRSWERWTELTFDGVAKGNSWCV